MRWLPLACVPVVLVALAGCGPRPAGIDDFVQLRTYGWDVPSPEAQGNANPVTNQVVVRAPNGFGVLDEGTGHQAFFRAQSGREAFWPAWINDRQFATGGAVNVEKLPDGRIVPPTEGLMVITLRDDGTVRERQMARVGYRPHVWQKKLVAQIENKMWLFNGDGDGEEYGEGFYPVPQREGEGLAYQETPVIDHDFWTSRPLRGQLFVQWRRGHLSKIASAIEPSWTATGGVVAVQLKEDPPKDQPWWNAGTTLVHLGGEGHRIEPIADDLRDPAAHPTQPVVAATTRDGRLVLVSLVDKRVRELAPVGAHPFWNHDGTRLFAQEPVLDKPSSCYLRAYVFKVRTPK